MPRIRETKRIGSPNPTLCTPDLIDKFIGYIIAGNYIETAAKACGIDKTSVYDWMRKGRDHYEGKDNKPVKAREPFLTFVKRLDEAQAIAEMYDIQTIRKASHIRWEAAAWRLERKFPKRWGRKRLEITGADGGPIQVIEVGKPMDLISQTQVVDDTDEFGED